MPIVVAAVALFASVAHAADLPPAGLNILDWPRMPSPAFGCFMEKTLGHRDPRFNCDLKSVPAGDPCVDTDDYYAGPKFPPTLIKRVHPLAKSVDVTFEHGVLRYVRVVLDGKFSDDQVRMAFGLPADAARRANIMYMRFPDCGPASTCLMLEGFDHMGAGDVDCSKNAPTRR